jgi:hypothetical protein
MEFHDLFLKTTEMVNSTSGTDERIKDALLRYDGRSLVLKVRNDGTYVFRISADGVDYQLDPDKVPDDMYAEMDMAQAKKLVNRHTLGFLDILTIKHRNISMDDIKFAKMLFGG